MKKIIFNGSADVLKYVQKNKGKISEFLDNNRSFVNYKNFNDIENGLKLGIKDYNQKFLKELKDIEDTRIETNDYFYTDNGLFYDMQSVVDGLPECMLDTQYEERKQLKIVADFSYPQATSDKVINYRGVSLFKLFYTLITKNYNLDISFATRVVSYFRRKEKILDLEFVLPKNEINVPTIAYYCNVEFFRAVTCSIIENEGLKCEHCQSRMFSVDNNDFFVGAGYTDTNTKYFRSVEDADKHITKNFNQYLRIRGIE